MSNFVKYKSRRLKRPSFGLLLVILGWSLVMGWLLASATNVYGITPIEVGTVDIVPAGYKLAEEVYIDNCSKCHIAIPPAVLPSQTWKNLLEDSQHYGVQLKPLVNPGKNLVWRYLLTFSRPQREDEDTPYRVDKSRVFKALHPKVKLPRPVQISSCVSCHPGAEKYSFRQLAAEWENSN